MAPICFSTVTTKAPTMVPAITDTRKPQNGSIAKKTNRPPCGAFDVTPSAYIKRSYWPKDIIAKQNQHQSIFYNA